ncbi:hypothetical protein PFISCL1PPCAC_293, partial [Pristionchus fissidentatus]
MQSLRILLAAATVIAAVVAQGLLFSVWEPTARDKTGKCTQMIEFIDNEHKCKVFDLCCEFDPLNGDKCQKLDKSVIFRFCSLIFALYRYSNCTEEVTTTTTTTTPRP